MHLSSTSHTVLVVANGYIFLGGRKIIVITVDAALVNKQTNSLSQRNLLEARTRKINAKDNWTWNDLLL